MARPDFHGSLAEEKTGSKHMMYVILHLLDKYQGQACLARITSDLAGQGMAVSEDIVRSYLVKLDKEGLTTGAAGCGKTITEKGRRELSKDAIARHAGFIIHRMNDMASLVDFDVSTGRGNVCMNISYVPEDRLVEALTILGLVFGSPHVMSDRVVLARGHESIGAITVPDRLTGLGTLCSITFNGVLEKAGIPVFSRLGGIIEIEGRKPVRFHDFISYQNSTVAPLEIFIKSRMTTVTSAFVSGTGSVLGSFREIPVEALPRAKRVLGRLTQWGIRNTILFGRPGQSLLGIPVPEGRVGLVVPGGSNANAVLHEAGIALGLQSMATLYPYSDLKPLQWHLDRSTPRMKSEGDRRREENH